MTRAQHIGKKMNRTILFIAALAATVSVGAADNSAMERTVDSLMARMTLQEKIGQLNFGGVGTPRVVGTAMGQDEAIAAGLVSAVGGSDPTAAYNAQRVAAESGRLPLLIGLDVIHGYYTQFPVPLGSASSWNLPLIERSARIAAEEASAFGVNWTFSPMVDICRDPRWGRIMEGAGEDPYLGAAIARAMVRGYQGDDLSDPSTIMACTKHVALYGASEAGRDYNTVSMDDVTMHNYYLPPYKAAFDEGAGSGMSSFNVINGIPATGNRHILTDILRGLWGWDGFIVSDANSVAEMTEHGLGDGQHVAELGVTAGCDMDLGSSHYVCALQRAVEEGRVAPDVIDTACRRILEAKYKLGLLEDPYRYYSRNHLRDSVGSPDKRAVARRLAAESIVLLKNDGNLLPLKGVKRLVVVGPMADAVVDLLGNWSINYSLPTMHSVTEALRAALPGTKVTSARGANFTEDFSRSCYGGDVPSATLTAEAVRMAASADVIIAAVGEPAEWTGEARNRANPVLPTCQVDMLRALKATGRPVVVVLMSGRPLIIPEIDKEFPAILQAWHGGTMAAEGLADLLTGKVCPSGKLTSTWPRSVGQIPLYYNHLNSGRPYGDFWATTKYIDMPNDPLYPFGYGLSYNTYEYGKLSADRLAAAGEDDIIKVSVDVTNRGNHTGRETVQLYIADPVASISRPVAELKDFRQVELAPGATATVTFSLDTSKLKFYNADGVYDWEPGEFRIMVGPSSDPAVLQTLSVDWQK